MALFNGIVAVYRENRTKFLPNAVANYIIHCLLLTQIASVIVGRDAWKILCPGCDGLVGGSEMLESHSVDR
jgi:hypothetical protein